MEQVNQWSKIAEREYTYKTKNHAGIDVVFESETQAAVSTRGWWVFDKENLTELIDALTELRDQVWNK